MTAATYIAIVAAIGVVLWRRPDDRRLLAGLRAALWVAWLHASRSVWTDARPVLLHATWFAAFVWAFPRWRGPARWVAPLLWSLLAVALPAAFGVRVGQPWNLPVRVGLALFDTLGVGQAFPWQSIIAVVMTGAAAVSGAWLFQAMMDGSGVLGRLTFHWLSFAGLVAVYVPQNIGELLETHPTAATKLAAVAAAAVSIALAVWSSAAFVRAGGTPEPLDAPARLATDGPFAHLRNPIQLAEIGMVAAAALWWPHPLTAAYALAFALALVGPVRWYEERRLRARFGAAYDRYRARTPAYLPRRRGAYSGAARRRSYTA